MQVAACSASFTLVIRSYLYGSEVSRFWEIYQENHNIDWCYIVWQGLRSDFYRLFPIFLYVVDKVEDVLNQTLVFPDRFVTRPFLLCRSLAIER